MIKIGLIGCGYWGINLLRNFFAVEECFVVKVCDLRKKRLELAKKLFPSIKITSDDWGVPRILRTYSEKTEL